MVLLLVFGVGPMLYALYLAFTKAGAFVGFANFVKVFGDFRFFPAVQHVAAFVAIWLVTLIVLVVLLALVVHAVRARWLSATARFLFYIPGALAGSASVMLWLFLLDPSVSPVAVVLNQFGFTSFIQTVDQGNLPVVFTVIAFWTGAGGWIIIMYGALNTISTDVMEAARIDGAGPFGVLRHISLPLLRPVFAIVAIQTVVAGMKVFSPMFIMTGGGPNNSTRSIAMLIYQEGLRDLRFGNAAAISVVGFAIIMVLTVIYLRVFRVREEIGY